MMFLSASSPAFIVDTMLGGFAGVSRNSLNPHATEKFFRLREEQKRGEVGVGIAEWLRRQVANLLPQRGTGVRIPLPTL